MYKGFKYRLYPTDDQTAFFERCFGHTRFVYNHFLFLRSLHYKHFKSGLSVYDCNEIMKDMKKTEEYSWLKEVSSQSLQVANFNVESAFSRFFKGLGKYPSFKSKYDEQSFSIPQNVKVVGNKIYIPKLKTSLKFEKHREMSGRVKSATIRKTPTGKYFISILCKVNDPKNREVPDTEEETGVDVGLKSYLVSRDGYQIANPKYLAKAEKKLKRLARQHSKKKKGGSNRSKARKKLAKQHEKVSNQRVDFQHKESFKLVKENQLIGMEDLSAANMMKNHKLAKAVADASWGRFRDFVEYKSEWYGRVYGEVDRFFPSTQLCSTENCDYRYHGITMDVRDWVCPECGVHHDRDENAQRNILIEVKRKLGLGQTEVKPGEKKTSVFSVKRIRKSSSLRQEAPA